MANNYYEEMRKAEKEFYLELAEELKKDNCKCFLYDEDFNIWMYVVTPNNSLLYIDRDDFGGYNITYEYTPSRQSGSGARYNDSPLREITYKTIQDSERFGLWACNHYHTKPYKDAMQALEKQWCFDKLVEM